MSNVTDGLCNH